MRRWNSAQLAELQQQQQKHQKQYQQQQQQQQPFPPPSPALKRMLSLQRPHHFRLNSRTPQVTPVAAVVSPLESTTPLPTPTPLTPPPLPPRGPRRFRADSEFSAIVLDVNRLFQHRRRQSGAGSASSSSSITSQVSDGGRNEASDGAESDDERDSEEADEEREGFETDDEERRSVDFTSGATEADASAAAALEAAAELEEAEDAYMEIPLRQNHAAGPDSADRSASQLRHSQHQQLRPSSSHGQPREFLESLETLKTPTMPESDPDSPTEYTTDCEDRYRQYLCQRLRNQSSLMLSTGEESANSGVPTRVDGLQNPYSIPRWASPVPGAEHPSLRRVSHSSRNSVASQSTSALPGRPSSAVERKVSRASRAVKLNYNFNTFSGKASLQKLGSQSLSRLEDMAQVGSTEQGTNYKGSYVSLYKPLHPLFLALKVFGAFHTRQNSGKPAVKFTHSYIYSGLVMLAVWFNVVRYLFVYDWGHERFDSLLFLKLTHHVIYIQAAVALTVMFRASGNFPRFFKACHEFMSRRHSLTYRYTLARRAKVSALIGLGLVVLEVIVFLIWANLADAEYYKTFLRPYTYVLPWGDASKGVLGFFYLAFDMFMSAAWVFPALLFCNFTWIFEREFRLLAHRLRLACTNNQVFVGDIEKFRLESWRISKLVVAFDQLFNFYVFTVFITDILSVCLILHNLIVGSFPRSGIIIEVWFWLAFALLRLFGVTISAARVNQAACSPLNIIQNMNLKEYSVNPARIGQLMIFLNKLTIGNIGFTAWNLFTLSRTTTVTIAAMIITYTVLFVKLGASYGLDDRLKPHRTTVDMAANTTTTPLI